MARINAEEIVRDLSSQFRKALTQAVQEVLPGTPFDDQELFHAFRKALRRKCDVWERVRDECVEIQQRP
ncbi:MAG TPA: hypothetical protein VGB38_02655 [bacterium]